MMRRYLKYISLIIATFLLASCGGGGVGRGSSSKDTSLVTIVVGNNEQSSSIKIEKDTFFANVKEFLEIFMPDEAAAAIPPSVYRIMFQIDGQGMTTITRNVLVSGKVEIKETFEVPNGLNRLFKAFAYNNIGDLLYSGSTLQNINGAATVQIIMQQVSGVSCIEPHNLATSHNSLMVYVPFRNSNNTINIDPSTSQKVFVSNAGSNNVSVIDTSTFQVQTLDCSSIGEGDAPRFDSVMSNAFNEPYAVAFTCDDSEAWVVNKGGSITLIDTATQSVVTTISSNDNCLFSSPEGIAIANGKAYVANSGNGTVCVVDVAARSVQTSINVGGVPRFAVATPNEQYVYVSNDLCVLSAPPEASGCVKRIRTSDNNVRTIPIEGRNLAVAPDGSRVYAGTQSNYIEVIDVSVNSTFRVYFTTASSIYGVTILNDGSLGFATDEGKGVVYRFEFDPLTNTPVPVTDAGGSPIEIPVGSLPGAITSAFVQRPLTCQ